MNIPVENTVVAVMAAKQYSVLALVAKREVMAIQNTVILKDRVF